MQLFKAAGWLLTDISGGGFLLSADWSWPLLSQGWSVRKNQCQLLFELKQVPVEGSEKFGHGTWSMENGGKKPAPMFVWSGKLPAHLRSQSKVLFSLQVGTQKLLCYSSVTGGKSHSNLQCQWSSFIEVQSEETQRNCPSTENETNPEVASAEGTILGVLQSFSPLLFNMQ